MMVQPNDEGKANILIANDNPKSLLGLTTILERPDYNLVTADSGTAVLRQVLNQNFAVILLDVNMPEMDGFETAQMIRRHPRTQHVPIIFVTAHRQDSTDSVQGYSLGAVDYLYAPVVPEILRAKVGVFVDLYRMAERLRRQTRQLEIANKELESFSSSVSHDLRAPLRAISGFAALLAAENASMSDKAKDYLQKIISSAQRMSGLIDDLLKLARVSQTELTRRPVDLLTIAQETMTELRAAQPERQLDFVTGPSAPVPGDARLLRVVLDNLLGNAWKFTARQTQARIECGVLPSKTPTVFYVRDNGAGFDMAHANKLFGIFQRMHSEREFPGTGVGLATVQRIIHRHGGRVWAESAPDKGTTIYFTVEEESVPAAAA